MSLSNLKNAISSLKSSTQNLGDKSLGDNNWKQCFIRMLDELSQSLRDMEGRIDKLEINQP